MDAAPVQPRIVHRYASHIADEEKPLEIPVALVRKVYAAPDLKSSALVLNDAEVDLDATTLDLSGGANNPSEGANNPNGGANNPSGRT